MVKELGGFSWITSLSTAGLIIVALTIIIIALAKFGVLNKILDNGKSEKNHKEVVDKIQTLLVNDEHVKEEIDLLQKETERQAEIDEQIKLTLSKLSDRVDEIEKSLGASLKDLQMEGYKKTILDPISPLIDKMAVSIKFMKMGGNSDTSKYILTQLAYMDKKTWNALCKALDAMKYYVNEDEKPNETQGV